MDWKLCDFCFEESDPKVMKNCEDCTENIENLYCRACIYDCVCPMCHILDNDMLSNKIIHKLVVSSSRLKKKIKDGETIFLDGEIYQTTKIFNIKKSS